MTRGFFGGNYPSKNRTKMMGFSHWASRPKNMSFKQTKGLVFDYIKDHTGHGIADDFCKRHRKFCASKNWFISKQQKRWIIPFTTLLRQVGEVRVDRVLTWYHANYPHKVWLSLQDGFEFCARFNQIERLMEQSRIHAREISPEAKKIADNLKSIGWKGEHIKDLPLAAEIASSSFIAFRKVIIEFCKDNPRYVEKISKWSYKRSEGVSCIKSKVMAPLYVQLAHHIRHCFEGAFSPYSLTTAHLRTIHASIGNHQYALSLLRRVWKGDYEDTVFCRHFGYTWASEFCKKPDAWDDLAFVLPIIEEESK